MNKRETQILRTRSDIAELIKGFPNEDEVFRKLSASPASPKVESKLDEIESQIGRIQGQLESLANRFYGLEIGISQILSLAESEKPTAAKPASKATPAPLKLEPTEAAYCPENLEVDKFLRSVIRTLEGFEVSADYFGFNKTEQCWVINVKNPVGTEKSFGSLSICEIQLNNCEDAASSIAVQQSGDKAYGLYSWDGDELNNFLFSPNGQDLLCALEFLEALNDRAEVDKVEVDKVKLTPSQEQAIAILTAWFEGREKEAALIGPAGTGKSFSLRALIKALIEKAGIELKEISLLAPTHKARKILESSIGADASTVAQALGQQPKLDENGKEVFEGKGGKSNSALTIIDEASMINAEDYNELVSLNNRILWVGDRYQLPPVKEKKSMAFESPSVRTQAELAEVIRYEGAIAEFCERLRRGDLSLPEPDGETLFLLGKKEWKKRAIEEAQATVILDDSTGSKVLAFRNRTVDGYNKAIKKAVFPKQKEPYFEGLKLVCNSPIQRLEYVSVGHGRWSKEELLWNIKATNSEELRVTSKPKIKTLTLDDFDEEPKAFTEWVSGWQVWEFEAITEGFLEITCRVLTPEFEEAKEAKIKQLGGNNYKALSYSEKDALKCLYRYFDKVADIFASTTHKAQGSGYDNVFVDWADLISARDMKQQLIYTACTRAKKRLFILKN